MAGGRSKRVAALGRAGERPSVKRNGRRSDRQDAILSAALEEFSAVVCRDSAGRYGPASRRRQIYLYFRDKESLFQDLVRAMVGPLVIRIEAAPLRVGLDPGDDRAARTRGPRGAARRRAVGRRKQRLALGACTLPNP
jgi:hypothetical protein